MKKSNPSNMKSTLFLTCCLFWSAAAIVTAQTTTNTGNLQVTGDLLIDNDLIVDGVADLGATHVGSSGEVRHYPNVVATNIEANVTGSLIINTPIPRTSEHTFSIRVRGYNWYHRNIVDVTVSGKLDAGNGPDGQPGFIDSEYFLDHGNDPFKKYVGINSAGNVVIALGDNTLTRWHEYTHYAVEATIGRGGSVSYPAGFATGWSVSVLPVNSGFGWIQELSQFPQRGSYAKALGSQGHAPGNYAMSLGYQTTANGGYSIVQGYQSTADSPYTFVHGRELSASGSYSRALGYQCVAGGPYAHAEGRSAKATANYSFAYGYYAESTANHAIALGALTGASGYGSFAAVNNAKATDNYAVGLGYKCEGNGRYSLAMGRQSIANHEGALVLADSQATDFSSAVADEFAVRAQGGVRFVTGGAGLDIDGPVNATGTIQASAAGGVTFGDATVQTTAALTPAEVQAMINSSLNNVQPQGGISMGPFQ